MNDFTRLLMAFLVGGALGLAYFYGLWLTVRHLHGMRWAALWLLASGALRMAALLAGLYFVGHGDWRRLLAALGGIVLVRLLLTTRLGKLRSCALAQPGPGSTP